MLMLLSFFSPLDKTYPEREGDSAESVAILNSMFLGVYLLYTHCQSGSPNVSVNRPFA